MAFAQLPGNLTEKEKVGVSGQLTTSSYLFTFYVLIDYHQPRIFHQPTPIVDQIRMVRTGNGPGVELFEYEAPDQDKTFRTNSDWGGHHVAFYVRHIDKAVEYLTSKGAQKRLGPFAVTAGPAAGQTINYFRTPFGTDIELISYPHGMAYEATAPIPLWDPRNNHP